MSKDYININAGRVILTKIDPTTGTLSTKPEDKRILTEVCDSISRKKSIKTYEVADGNSNYPAGTYEEGIDETIEIALNTWNTATLAFLENATIIEKAGTVKELTQVMIPLESPYEIKALGKVVGKPTVLNDEDIDFTKVTDPETGDPKELATKEYKVVPGTGKDPSKFVFAEADAGKTLTLEYVFEADKVESYEEDENPILSTFHAEIIYETLTRDKTKRFKNNTTISRAQLNGDITHSYKKQAGTATLSLKTVKPAGSKSVYNKRTEIPLN